MPRLNDSRGLIRAIVIIIVILIIVGIAWAIKSTNTPQKNPNFQTKTNNNTQSPDRVKDRGGPNGDIQPSSNGTGPGSNNSLLGPQ
jgi:hypothetical protein